MGRHPECRHLLDSLSDYLDGDLPDELCNEIERHMSDCDNCRVVVDTLRNTISLYRTTSSEADLPEAARQRLFHRLNLDEFLNV
jgi:anti-sigma factor (TIGR02949 family)